MTFTTPSFLSPSSVLKLTGKMHTGSIILIPISRADIKSGSWRCQGPYQSGSGSQRSRSMDGRILRAGGSGGPSSVCFPSETDFFFQVSDEHVKRRARLVLKQSQP